MIFVSLPIDYYQSVDAHA